MEFTGKVIWKGSPRSGQGKNGEWKSLEFALENNDGQYPKKACFEAGTKSFDYADKLKKGDTVTVTFDLDASEYNGRYYNKLKAFKIMVSGGSQGGGKQQAPPPSAIKEDDGLPF